MPVDKFPSQSIFSLATIYRISCFPGLKSSLLLQNEHILPVGDYLAFPIDLIVDFLAPFCAKYVV